MIITLNYNAHITNLIIFTYIWFRVYVNGDFVSPTYYTYSYNGATNEIVFVFSLTYPLDANDEIAITGKFQEL